MPTLNEIAYNILNSIEGGRSTHNSYYSLDQIKFNIDIYRALFLRRDLRDGHDISNFSQPLEIRLDRISQSSKPAKYVLKTVDQIPTLLRTRYQIPLYITDTNRNIIYPVLDHMRQHWMEFSKYSKHHPFAYILDNYLYIGGDQVSKALADYLNNQTIIDPNLFLSDITDIYIYGVFQDPRKVMEFNDVDISDIDDQEYPITSDFIQRISEGILQGKLNMMSQIPPDITHDNLPNRATGQ